MCPRQLACARSGTTHRGVWGRNTSKKTKREVQKKQKQQQQQEEEEEEEEEEKVEYE